MSPTTAHSPDQIDPSISTFDDTTLVEACLQGNDQAWAMLLARYSGLIYTIPLHFGFSQNLAEEIFQEVCLTLLEKLSTIHNPQRLSAWIVTITRRLCIQTIRRKDLTVTIETLEEQPAEMEPVDEQLLRLEQQHLVRKALANLDERCQYLLKVLFFETVQPSYETIAAQFGLSVGSIGPNRARCLERLRVEILQLEQATI